MTAATLHGVVFLKLNYFIKILHDLLLAHGLSLPPGLAPDAPAAQNDSTLRLPSDADIDRAIAFVGHVWQRFVDAITRVQKQVFNKS